MTAPRILQRKTVWTAVTLISLIMVTFAYLGSAAPQEKQAKTEVKEKKLSQKEIIKNLDPKYRDWLDLVSYIMHDTEHKIFLELTNDRDRDLFIDLFWSLRDPTPGTPENEYREEHIKRFKYANYYFKFGAGRPGWMTDMGRIYILLGDPDSRDRYDVDSVVNPTQLWSYSGKGRPGLPNAFWVIFFKRGEAGEYKIYNPLSDGPYALLKRTYSASGVDPNDNEAIFEKIRERHDILAMASLSLLPDEPSPDFRPTMSSQYLLSSIFDLPKKVVNASYATNFLKYRGMVKVDYSMNYIENVSTAQVLRDPGTGMHFLHFAVLPKAISINFLQEKDKYYFNFRLDVSLKKGEQTVFSYQKNFPFYLEEDEAKQKFGNGVVISDYLPVPVGDYELRVMVQNDVKKEFSYLERKFSVKPDSQTLPVIFGPMFSHEQKRIVRNAFLPWKVGDIEWTPSPRSEFGSSEHVFLWTGLDRCEAKGVAGLSIVVEDLADTKKFKNTIPVAIPADQKLAYHLQDLGPLPPGNYRCQVRAVTEGGVALAATEAAFMVSTQPSVPHPTTASKMTSSDNAFLFFHILGNEYMALENVAEAEANYEKALQLKSDNASLVKDYSALLLKKKEYDRILAISEPLRNHNETLFDYYALRGKALYYKGLTDMGLENLQKANSIYDSNIEVLNLLGLSYIKVDNKAEAKKALQASLKLFPNQKDIGELLKKLD